MTRMMTIEQLGELGNELGSGGQARVIELRGKHRRNVAKLYHPEGADTPRPTAEALAEVIDWRDALPAQERAIVDARTSWPSALLTDAQGRSVGVLLPAIPRDYFAEIRVGNRRKIRPRELSYLLTPKASELGVHRPDLDGRMQICRAWMTVFDVLDSHGVVFGDISMRNLLWSPSNRGEGYVIDCDTAQTDPPQAPSPLTMDWEDPHFRKDLAREPADLASDRYKLTLAVYRAIVGHPGRRPPATIKQIHQSMPEPVPDAVAGLLLAGGGPDRDARPRPSHWLAVMDAWLPVDARTLTQPDRREPEPRGTRSTSKRPRPRVRVRQPSGNEHGQREARRERGRRPEGASSTAKRQREIHRVHRPEDKQPAATAAGDDATSAGQEPVPSGSPTRPAVDASAGRMSSTVKFILWAVIIAVIVIVATTL